MGTKGFDKMNYNQRLEILEKAECLNKSLDKVENKYE